MSTLEIDHAHVDSKSLERARLQLHWAAQVAGSVGLTYVEPVSDFSHTSLSWSNDLWALMTRAIGDQRDFAAGLRLSDLTLIAEFLGDVSQMSLHGRTLQDAYEWLSSRISQSLGDTFQEELRRFDHDMPDHPVASGGPFSLIPARALQEMDNWYRYAFELLEEVAKTHPHASPVRCWPHHFDVATLITLDPPESDEQTRSIGVGMSPGDLTYSEPYWYVTPWPYPAPDDLPEIPFGVWHTAGWIGSVLRRSHIIEWPVATYEKGIRSFLTSGIAACTKLLSAA